MLLRSSWFAIKDSLLRIILETLRGIERALGIDLGVKIDVDPLTLPSVRLEELRGR